MRLWDHLYMGQNADRARARILKGLRQGSLLPDTYVITLPENGKHIFDICPVSLLTRRERQGENLLSLGIARGYHEAAEVTGRMVDDMYHQTGGFDWKAYMDQMAGK